jgi:hypothetical protein
LRLVLGLLVLALQQRLNILLLQGAEAVVVFALRAVQAVVAVLVVLEPLQDLLFLLALQLQ